MRSTKKPIVKEETLRLTLPSPLAGFLNVLMKDTNPVYNLQWIFRGQTEDWPLIPAGGRYENNDGTSRLKAYLKNHPKLSDATKKKIMAIRDIDLQKFEHWKSGAEAIIDKVPANEFRALAMAQHYGLHTRLLDWSTNAMVALFFAVQAEPKKDGVFYAVRPGGPINIETKSLISVKEAGWFRVPPFDRRLAAQAGCFTYHPKPKDPYVAKAVLADAKSDVTMLKIYLPAVCKDPLRHELSSIGFNHRTLFPDLDGLSRHLNWERRVKGM